MTKKTVIFFTIILVSISTAFPKQSIDSLKTLLSISHNDSNYVDILNKLSKAYRWNNQVLSIDYAVKAEKIAKSNNYAEGLAMAYHNLGAIYADKQNNDMAIEYYGRSLRIQQSLNNQKGMANLYGNLGLIYRRKRNYEKAHELHEKSLRIKRKLNDTIGIAYSYGNIGLVYSDQGKYDKALIQFYNSLRLKESLNDKYGMANSYGNIGVVYLKIGNIDQAQVNLERSLQFFEATNNNSGIAECLLYLGDIYYQQHNNAKAIKTLNRSLSIYKDNGNLKGQADSHIKIGEIQFKIDQIHNASENFLMAHDFYQKINNINGLIDSKLWLARYNYTIDSLNLAKYQLKSALKLSQKHQLNTHKYEILKLLAQVYLKQENYYRASELLLQTNALGDSLNQTRLDKEVTKIQMQHEFDNQIQEREFETRQKQQENRQKIKRISQLGYAFFAGLMIALTLMIIIFRKNRTIRRKNNMLEKQQIKIETQIDELQEQKKELLLANATKDRFLAIIGHDLRNPFNAINGFINMVTDQPGNMDSEMVYKYLKLIKEAGANAQNLLENLLEWALNQSDDLEIKKEKVSLNYILHGNVLLIKEAAQQKNITLEEHLEGEPSVIIDKNMINTVIRNLLSNALKFTSEGGKIELSTKTQNGDVKISIRDTGTGMTSDQLNSLFEPRLIKKGKDGVSSSGLGLILCHDFLRNHHQELHVESTPNIGTTFWFYLPLAD